MNSVFELRELNVEPQGLEMVIHPELDHRGRPTHRRYIMHDAAQQVLESLVKDRGGQERTHFCYELRGTESGSQAEVSVNGDYVLEVSYTQRNTIQERYLPFREHVVHVEPGDDLTTSETSDLLQTVASYLESS